MYTLPNRLWKVPIRIIRAVQNLLDLVSLGGVSLADLFGEIRVAIKEVNLMIGFSILGLLCWIFRPSNRLERAYRRRFTREVRLEPATVVYKPGPVQVRRSCPKDHCTLENPCDECAVYAERINEQSRRDHERQQRERRRERERREATIRYRLSNAWRRFRRWLYTQ